MSPWEVPQGGWKTETARRRKVGRTSASECAIEPGSRSLSVTAAQWPACAGRSSRRRGAVRCRGVWWWVFVGRWLGWSGGLVVGGWWVRGGQRRGRRTSRAPSNTSSRSASVAREWKNGGTVRDRSSGCGSAAVVAGRCVEGIQNFPGNGWGQQAPSGDGRGGWL